MSRVRKELETADLSSILIRGRKANVKEYIWAKAISQKQLIRRGGGIDTLLQPYLIIE